MNIASKAVTLAVIGTFIGIGLSAQPGQATTEIVDRATTAPHSGNSELILCKIDGAGNQVLSNLDVSRDQPISSTQ